MAQTRGARPARHDQPGERAPASPRPSPRRAPAARPRQTGAPTPRTPAPASAAAGPHSPSLAFFLRARVPPSFPKKESSFFRDGGDLGVGDLGTEGDFCGEEAMAVERTSRGPVGTRSWRWAGAAGLRLRLSKRKRNYSKHLRQLTLAFPFPLSLPRAALRPARSCALGPSLQAGLLAEPFGCPKPGGCPTSAPGRMCSLIQGCVSDPPAWERWSLKASFPPHPARILAQTHGSVIAELNPPVPLSPRILTQLLTEVLALSQHFYLCS